MKIKRRAEAVEITRGFNHHTKEKLRIVLGNMYADLDFGFSAYGGHDVDLIYWMTVGRHDGRKLMQGDIYAVQVATQAIIATVKSYGA